MRNKILEVYYDLTLAELLHHTSGLHNDVFNTPSWMGLRSDTRSLREQRKTWLTELLTKAPENEKGKYFYSNVGYIVAGAMLEEKMDESWEDLIQNEVFSVLGMEHSGFGAPGISGRDQPWGHMQSGKKYQGLEPGPFSDNPLALGPAGTIHVTIRDYSKFMMLHLLNGKTIPAYLTEENFKKLHEPAVSTNYAKGWVVAERKWANGIVYQHAGSNAFWYAVVWIAPELNIAIFSVCNIGGEIAANATDKAVETLIARYFNR